MSRPPAHGVALPEGCTGSSFLHEVLLDAQRAFPDALGAAPLPEDPRAFKNGFADAVTGFEAARAASADRVRIARHARRLVDARLRFVDDRGARPFQEAVREAAAPLPLRRIETRGGGRLTPTVTHGGRAHAGARLRGWLADRRAQHHVTDAVVQAVTGLLDQGEPLDLSDHRFVLFGAAAELSPAPLLLAAGAEVLWIDLKGPDALRNRDDLGGVLHVPEAPANLLEDPAAIAATIRAFAAEGPVHLGLYAYAGGQSQEWRLAAAMNGIAQSLPRELLRSVSLLVSPTTAVTTTPADHARAEAARGEAPRWQRLLAGAGVLDRRSHDVPAGVPVARSLVPLQGASYQAAQYVEKVLAAETWACDRGEDAAGLEPLRVSANVAPITATRSLSHPVFEAGFLGAARWGILIAEPVTTRELQALVLVHDLTSDDAPCGRADPLERARALWSQQSHGGVYAQPYALDGAIRVAAVQGFAQRPGLLKRLVLG